MIDLREEIEKLKCKLVGDTKYDSYMMGNDDCVEAVLEILNQYNIITAPKTILLSEIVSRLKESHIFNDSKISVCKHNNKIDIWEDYEFDDIVDEKCSDSRFLLSIDNKNKVDLFCRDFTSDEHKWLYTLWIAETTIIDDLEEVKQDEQH